MLNTLVIGDFPFVSGFTPPPTHYVATTTSTTVMPSKFITFNGIPEPLDQPFRFDTGHPFRFNTGHLVSDPLLPAVEQMFIIEQEPDIEDLLYG